MNNVNLSTTITSASLHDTEEGMRAKITKAVEYYNAENIQETLNLVLNDKDLLKSSYVHVLIGNCYRKQNKIDSALKSWQKAVEINEKEYNAYINIANVQFVQGDAAQAIENWTKAFSIQPENPVVCLNLAIAYNQKGCRIKSTKFFERYLRYNRNNMSREYLSVKESMLRLRTKVDYYFKKLAALKNTGNLKLMATINLKMISIYADLPTVYNNLGQIFMFTKDYDKALDFFLTVYKNFPYSPLVLWNIATIFERKGKRDWAYCFYKRCSDIMPKTSQKAKVITEKANSFVFKVKTKENSDIHLKEAKDFEAKNLYEDALVEYENAYLLSPDELADIEHKIQVLKTYIQPEPFVIADLYSRINNAMNNNLLKQCVEMCDRIILLSDSNSKESSYALKCKTECKRILATRGRIDSAE